MLLTAILFVVKTSGLELCLYCMRARLCPPAGHSILTSAEQDMNISVETKYLEPGGQHDVSLVLKPVPSPTTR